MAKSFHVKKGDTVEVICGDHEGAIGEIIAVFPKEGRVIVEGVNLVKKHTAANPNAAGKNTGGIIETEAPIHASNVQLVTGSGKKAQVTRVGYKRVEVTKRRPDGTEYTATRSVRIARKTGEEI